MFYPLFLSPFFKQCVWGGEGLKKKLNKQYKEKNIGESFEVSCYKNYLSTIKNGVFKETHLKTLVETYPKEILGKNISSDFFPLIIKFLDAKDKLSVQVHPNDKYAIKNAMSLGKNELWYVAHANENSRIVLGVKNYISIDDIKASIDENNFESVLNIEKVNIGDCIFIPSGTVHALLEDIIVLEVQQASDVTYRLYDWNRENSKVKRDLHIKDALNVLNVQSRGNIIRRSDYSEKSKHNLISIKDFTVDYIKINNSYLDDTFYKSFHIYTCIDGNGRITYNGESNSIERGDTFLIPACLGSYEIRGNLQVLKTYV